jgi:signal transduction histidine kinase/HAMP domain-containing protein
MMIHLKNLGIRRKLALVVGVIALGFLSIAVIIGGSQIRYTQSRAALERAVVNFDLANDVKEHFLEARIGKQNILDGSPSSSLSIIDEQLEGALGTLERLSETASITKVGIGEIRQDLIVYRRTVGQYLGLLQSGALATVAGWHRQLLVQELLDTETRLRASIEAVKESAAQEQEARRQHIVRETDTLFWVVLAAMAIVATAVFGLAISVGLDIGGPVSRLAETVDKLAAGQWNAVVYDTTRQDEVGKMARALEVLCQAGRNNEQLRAEREQQRALLQQAIDALPLSFSMFSADGLLELYNPQFVREFRTAAGQIELGKTLADVFGTYWDTSPFPPRLVDPVTGKLKELPPTREEYVARCLEGLFAGETRDVSRAYGEYRVTSIRLPDGGAIRVSADVTDLRHKEDEIRRLAETALARRTTVLQEVLHSVPQALALLSEARDVDLGNRSLGRLAASALGANADLSMLSLHTILLAAGLTPEQIDHVERAKKLPFEYEVLARNNVPLRIQLQPITTGQVMLSISDLTSQRRAEAERLAQQEKLLSADKSQAVATLAGSVAHDFNNLLAVILGFSSLAGERLQRLSRSAASYHSEFVSEVVGAAYNIDNVIASAERGRHIVASLTGLTREKKSESQVLDLRTIVSACEEFMRVLMPSSTRLELSLPLHPCLAVVQSTKIEQVITNLCINGMHAFAGRAGQITLTLGRSDVDDTPTLGSSSEIAAARHHGGAHVEVLPDESIVLTTGNLKPGRYVTLEVADNGSGMTEGVARNLFTPFFTTKGAGKGTGLGLNSVLEIVTSHGGCVHMRTRAGVGTQFKIFLPEVENLPVEAGVRPMAAASAIEPSHAVRTDARVLVVDDEKNLVELMTAVLRNAGYEVEGYTAPLAALKRFSEAPDQFDLAITDQSMPQMTGAELIGKIHAIRGDLPAIICTGYTPDVGTLGESVAGVKLILGKPYTPAELSKAARDTLAAVA